MEPSDQELFLRIQRHDAQAFELAYARLAPELHRHLERMLRDAALADDVLQETMLRLWTHAEQWGGRGSPRAWLYRVATNRALNQLRSIRRQRQEPLVQPHGPADLEEESGLPAWMVDNATMAPEEAAEHAERLVQLRRLIARLPEEKRAVVRMVHELEMDIADVAQALGIPAGTVKSRLHYATRRLASEWREAEGED
jgi:RNA polymerase sigma-70 factor (ECF subfamily)